MGASFGGARPRLRPRTAVRSRRLGLSLGSTYALVRGGTIPATRLGGRWLIPRARFHVWLDGITYSPSAVGTEHRRSR
ncbi:MAG: helix-turn-helix domain-containing protein [Micromonospora sp.]